MINCDYVKLSEKDLQEIETNLLPKAKRRLVWASVFLLGLSLIGPYIGGKSGSGPLIEIMTYPRAFLICFAGSSVFELCLYWKTVRALTTDWKTGEKCVFKTRIIRKVWKGHEEFELSFDELPKALARHKFTYPATESENFRNGDVVILQYLERSAVLLEVCCGQ